MKINRKGFTLVELLVTILIVGLVIGLTVFGIIKLTSDSEDKVNTISVKNVEEAARIYSAEASNDSWKKNDEYEFDAFCTTIGELMNKGFIDKKASFADDLTRNNYVIVKRNKITLAIDSASVIEDNTDDDRICTSQNIVEDEEYTKPSIGEVDKYTDRIEIDFNNGSAKSGIKNYKCLYGESSSNVNREALIEGNKCILDGLKNNKEYYVLIYMNTNKGSSILAEGDREYSTKDFVDTTISQNANKVNITYKDDNIYGEEEYHYIKSGINGTSGENVLSCDFNNNKFTCDETTSVIEKDKWYKVNNNNITITYPEENSRFNIDAKICDDSNNCKDNNKEIIINKYVVKFYRNGALNVDGSTNEYVEKYCITGENGTCSIVSPTFTSQVGYSVLGSNRSSSATSSEWNVGTTKEINSNVSYYAISRINKVYIKYNVNGGSIATSSNDTGTWTKNSSGTVLLNGSVLKSSINYGSSIGTNGLTNYNNSNVLNISRTGYTAVSGAEWKCLSSNCKQDTYSQKGYVDTGYTSASFCDSSNSDCTVELGVNWKLNSSTVNANKFACENSRLAVYYVTVCNGNTCTYSKKNGLNNSYSFDLEDTVPTWSINKTTYVDELDELDSSCSYSLRYVTASGGSNCRSGASTSASVTRKWNKCTALYVYPTTIQYRASSDNKLYRWYYSKTYGCYLTGYNLGSSKPSSCSSSSSTCTYTCVKDLGGACDNVGGDWGFDDRCYKYNQSSCATGWDVYEKECS